MSHDEFEDWYGPRKTDADSTEFLNTVYQEAIKLFTDEGTHNPDKIAFVNSKTRMQDVQAAVEKALESYRDRHARRATMAWLSKAASRIQFYGQILDVISQHHPEYVALGWGAVKFFLVAVINHEDVNTTLANALLEIGDLLPRVELASTLYPTARMKSAISTLYAYLLKFFIRSRNWYNEGSWKRMVHSITKPSELRYKDLLAQIGRASKEIDQLSRAASQSEIRTIHNEIDGLQRNLKMLQGDLTLTKSGILDLQTICSAGFLNTNQQLTDLQFSQIMQFLTIPQGGGSESSSSPLWDPLKTFRYLSSLRRRRPDLAASFTLTSTQFRNSAKLRRWSTCPQSSLLVVKGNPQSRFALRDFCVDVIASLNSSKTPYLLALRVPVATGGNHGEGGYISTVDLLKYLTRQALQLRGPGGGGGESSSSSTTATEKSMALSCSRFHSAVSEEEWFQVLETVLGDVVASVGGTTTVYIVIELDMLHRDLTGVGAGFSLASSFAGFFAGLEQRRGLKSRVKVLLVTYDPENLKHRLCTAVSGEPLSTEVLLSVRATPMPARRRQHGRGGACGGQGGRGNNRGMWLGRLAQ